MVQDGDGKSDPAGVAGALMDLAHWLETATGDAGWLAALRFGVAGGLAQAGEIAWAEAGFRRILSQTPDHLWSWIGLVDLALARGDVPAAFALGHEGLTHLPQDRLLRRKTAEAAETAQGPVAALAILSETDADAWVPEDLHYAITLHRAAQSVVQAEPLCAALLRARPGDALALLALVEARLTLGDGAGAVAAGQSALDHHPMHPEIRLRAAQAHLVAGDPDLARAVAEGAPDRGGFAEAFQALLAQITATERTSPPDFATLMRDLAGLLAKGSPHVDGAALIEDLRACTDLPWYRALDLVALAWTKGAAEVADQISAACADRAWNAADRQAFAIEDRLLRDGPRAALDWIAAHPTARRDAEAAERVGRVLLMAGTGALAARYLRLCCRRWPDAEALLDRATEAMIACDGADQVADLWESRASDPPVLAARMRAGLALGDLSMAQTPTTHALPAMIEAHLLAGDLAAAEACLARLSITDGPLAEALICRPRATRLGALLNEARVLAALGVDWRGSDPATLAPHATGFFLPARRLVALWQGAGVPVAAGAGALHLIWPAPTPRPSEAQRLIQEWTRQGWGAVRCIGPEEGRDWLGRHHGAKTLRAYDRAQDAAERADLLALAVLAAAGGLVVQGAQWPGAGLRDWAARLGETVLVRDGAGAVVPTLMQAPPGHPLIALALEMALAACHDGEREHRWHKTGPGMLTRALAVWITRTDPPQDAVQIVPEPQLRRHLHPYGPAALEGG